MKFRKKPVTVEAWPFYGNRTDVVHCVMPEWMRDAIASGSVYYQGGDDPYYTIKTLEGIIRARVGDWIIRGVAGEIYPCKPDIFERIYEPVEEAEALTSTRMAKPGQIELSKAQYAGAINASPAPGGSSDAD